VRKYLLSLACDLWLLPIAHAGAAQTIQEIIIDAQYKEAARFKVSPELMNAIKQGAEKVCIGQFFLNQEGIHGESIKR
jgi:hypothetical protein